MYVHFLNVHDMNIIPRSSPFVKRKRKNREVFSLPIQLVEKAFFEYFLGAAHTSLPVAKLCSASEVRHVSACQGALLLGFSRFFEKNRVKLFILRTFFRNFNASADFYVSAKLVFRQSQPGSKPGFSFTAQPPPASPSPRPPQTARPSLRTPAHLNKRGRILPGSQK